MSTKANQLFLIFTPIDNRYKDADSHYSPSLSLLSLKNYLNNNLPDLEISIFDGSVCYTKEEIIEQINKQRPSHVAQSIQLISYKNSLDISAAAKSVGAVTIVGGHHATQMARTIASKRDKLIDYVVVGDGEHALFGLVTGQDVSTIPNLVFSRQGRLTVNRIVNICLDELPVTDYSGVDYSPYKRLLKGSEFNTDGCEKYLRMYSHKGCGNRGGSQACIFCGRADKNVRFKRPAHYWRDVLSLVVNNEADYIFDVGDDFLASEKWLRSVVSSKPIIEKKYQVGIFGRANRVSKLKAELIKDLNVSDVVIGFETGSTEIMSKIGKKNTSIKMNVDAAEHLFNQDIDVCASFVYGLPGETERTMESTITIANTIVEMSKSIRGIKPREMVGNMLEPSPGSPAFNGIVKAFPHKYLGKDIIELDELQYDYFRLYFGIASVDQYNRFRQKMLNSANQLHKLVDFADSQGWLKNESTKTTH